MDQRLAKLELELLQAQASAVMWRDHCHNMKMSHDFLERQVKSYELMIERAVAMSVCGHGATLQ
jgi:hypothetical protein